MTRFAAALFSAGVMALAMPVCGQNYPNRPVRIVTSESGSGTDFAARVIAQGLAGSLGQQAIVDNRAVFGAIDMVSKAPADGYTLLFYGSTVWLSPFLRSNVPYDPVKDFAPITLATGSPSLLVLNSSVPAKSVKELIALAQARPGELNYSSGSIGGSAHLSAELFNNMAGVNIVRVPYKGSGPSLNALIAGQVQLMFPATGSVTPHIKSGRLRALAVTSARPSALAPGLPTIADSGLPGYESVSILGMFAPAKTPAPIINRLHREIVRFLNQADVKENLFNAGLETVGNTPEQFAATIKSAMATMGKLIRDLGIKGD